jgi:hypothetical protein
MRSRVALCASLIFLLAGASGDALAGRHSMNKQRMVTLYDYSSLIHWSDFDKAEQYLDPQTLADHPITDLDRARYKQVQVSQYDVRTSTIEPDGSYDQVVEIHLFNVHDQVERVVTDHQHWRWDPTAKRWWLTTGLPDITQSDGD